MGSLSKINLLRQIVCFVKSYEKREESLKLHDCRMIHEVSECLNFSSLWLFSVFKFSGKKIKFRNRFTKR